ncbi:MAG: hypothetical protein OdinLCB4_000185 [Candidatus Odinarchaeum yellowstonii]|uniref:Uncharacterized protein n=1 Tax=Odinarchaeota yellowstonii (strain LCB_4) TaxID=1841599 RepID=A0AAF0IB42_ODILC|nr:MAG: hypothetical protein OdinLCB4_000185 [Candidatus Odinarchaeum yellowstonii]
MAMLTATDALNDAINEKDPLIRSRKFYEACLLLFKAGRFNDALKYIENVTDSEQFINLITDEYFNTKLFEMSMSKTLKELLLKAEEKASSLNSLGDRIRMSLKISLSYFRIGLSQEAHRIVESILESLKKYNGGDRDSLLCTLVDVQSKISDLREARQAVSEIKNPYFKSLALLYIVKAFSFKEQTDEAILIANEIEDYIQRSNAFTYIAAALIRKKNIHEAELISELITVPVWRERIKHWINIYR